MVRLEGFQAGMHLNTTLTDNGPVINNLKPHQGNQFTSHTGALGQTRSLILPSREQNESFKGTPPCLPAIHHTQESNFMNEWLNEQGHF